MLLDSKDICYEISNISFAYRDNKILDDITAYIENGKITTIIGPNGSGKSTLLYLMMRELKQQEGTIKLADIDIRDIKNKEFAKRVAAVYQYNTTPEDITVKELVSYGRIPYKHFSIGNNTNYDMKVIKWALEITELEDFADRPVSNMSGGQQQRVWIAMALAQESGTLILDEPTTYLDLKYQIDTLNLIKKLNKEHKITIVMVLHDLNQALRYSDNIIAMKDGKVYKIGEADEIITENMIRDVYGISARKIEIDKSKFIIAG